MMVRASGVSVSLLDWPGCRDREWARLYRDWRWKLHEAHPGRDLASADTDPRPLVTTTAAVTARA